MSLRTISYGGGVQSTALLVLAAQCKIDFRTALFANVGDDSEHPATLDYVRNVAMPWAAEHGIAVHELHRVKRDGTRAASILGRVTQHDDPTTLREPFPVRGMNGAPLSRGCTRDWKIQPIGKWLKANGASKDNPATVAIGISTDEFHRANNKRAEAYERPTYPLLDLGIDRSRCQTIISDAGLPVPPKSSCFFCPFHRPQTWAEMRRDEPELFEKSADLEELLNARRDMLGKDHVYLTRFNKPLRDAVPVAQNMLPLFDESPDTDGCDSGHCWT